MSADVITLRNGRTIEGAVVDDDGQSVTIRIAMGEIIVRSEKILSIEKDDSGNILRDGLEKTRLLKKEIGDLKKKSSGFQSRKSSLSAWNIKAKNLRKDQQQIQAYLSKKEERTYDVYAKLIDYENANQLTGDDRKKKDSLTSEYNKLCFDMNRKASRYESNKQSLKACMTKIQELEKKFGEEIVELNIAYNNIVDQGCLPSEIKSVRRVIGSATRDVKSREIPLFRRDGAFYIDVLLNGSVEAEFILDTGCSGLLINRELEKTIQLRDSDYFGTSYARIADNNRVKVNQIRLRSVEVGGFEVRNVIGMSPSEGSSENAPLLLGMGFLKNFNFHIDTSKCVLILREHDKYRSR